ncbi:MAG: helix-turn-helix domain-containing protein [Leptolyngbyaceae bacterium]|nr:helix-turn-helix domain-containing protein [Leptolyngbyaceae bacterium]
MSKVVQIEITETAEQLQTLLKQQQTASAKERALALYWLKTGTVQQVTDLAAALGRDRTTVQRWLQCYRRGGLSKLLKTQDRTGRHRAIPADVMADLQQRLQQPGYFQSYDEIVQWLNLEHGLCISYSVVYTTVRQHLGIKLTPR